MLYNFEITISPAPSKDVESVASDLKLELKSVELNRKSVVLKGHSTIKQLNLVEVRHFALEKTFKNFDVHSIWVGEGIKIEISDSISPKKRL